MTDAKPLVQVGRLALRIDGDDWKAYYALPDTMEGAIFLGSIRVAAVVASPVRKQDFMNLMRNVVADIIEEKVGIRPDWGGPRTAPEHERSGSG